METLKILVVDDEQGIRSGVTRILKTHRVSYPFMDDDFEFSVMEAATGEESIEILEKEKPDIILLDNKLPGIQGTDVLDYIRDKHYNTVVAMITSYASLDLAVKVTGQGAYDFIPKPFTPQELKASVDNIVKQLFLKRITQNLQKEGKQVRFQFLSVLSHELKAPLSVIEGYLHIMQEKQAGNDISAYEKMIESSVARIAGMRNLIMNLLDLTKIQFEKKEEKFEETDLRQIVKLSISTVQPYAIQKNIQIDLHCAGSIFYMADPQDMEIITNNLLSNAVKFNVDDGQVDIYLEKQADCICIVIQDTGIGMNQEDISLLFGEFVRIKNERTKNITGSGLGLSIVKKVVDLYDGTIKVDSEPGKGTKFTVSLPVKNL
jgi:two-component system, sensor histidine kinase and response regulator